jgi:hypothetical protein
MNEHQIAHELAHRLLGTDDERSRQALMRFLELSPERQLPILQIVIERLRTVILPDLSREAERDNLA